VISLFWRADVNWSKLKRCKLTGSLFRPLETRTNRNKNSEKCSYRNIKLLKLKIIGLLECWNWIKKDIKTNSIRHQESISSTFYVQCTNVVLAVFSSLVLALLKNSYEKRTRLTLMTLTASSQHFLHRKKPLELKTRGLLKWLCSAIGRD